MTDKMKIYQWDYEKYSFHCIATYDVVGIDMGFPSKTFGKERFISVYLEDKPQ